jgi:hypothetical protein
LKGIRRDQECNSNEDIEEAITVGANDLTFEDGQCVFPNWVRSVTCIIENGRESPLE